MRHYIAAAALFITACSDKDTTTVVTPDGRMDVTQDSTGNVTQIVTKDANGQQAAMTIGATWPAGLPAYVTPYPDAKIVSTMSGTSGREGGTVIVFTTSDPAEQVTGHYAALAKANGLTNVTNMSSPTGNMFSAEKPGTGDLARQRPDLGAAHPRQNQATLTPPFAAFDHCVAINRLDK